MNWLNEGLLLVPWPQEIDETGENWSIPRLLPVLVSANASQETRRTAQALVVDLVALTGVEAVVATSRDRVDGIRLVLGTDVADVVSCPARTEGYSLTASVGGVTIAAFDEAGLAHGAQTLLQLVAFSHAKNSVPGARIRDWPQYAMRALMLDMGRAPFTRALIERVIRIMSRLKLNALHLHLHDDELNAVRYAHLPLGSENPAALDIAEYSKLIQYAHERHICVIPELEAWGHVSSILYHYPQLYGTTGAFGQSLAICEDAYDLLGQMFEEWVPILVGEPCYLHVGLDEADWAIHAGVPEEHRASYTPVTHVRRLYDILERLGERHGKHIEMQLWADHGGRPIPEALKDKVVTQPWQYHMGHLQTISANLAKYGGEGKTPFMMGAGASFVHEQGAFAATQAWCRQAVCAPNCRGVTICLWGSNDVAGRLVSVFAGADYAWSPEMPPDLSRDEGQERLRGWWIRRMKHWQAHFPDADPAAIDAERGPEALMGRYCGPGQVGLPAGPTADWETMYTER